MSLEQRIERLEAYRGIDVLIVALGRAFDAGPSAEQLRPLFTSDAVFLLDQFGSLVGADAIADGVVANATQGFRWTLHYLVSPRTSLAQDASRADVEFMLWEVATASSGRAYWIGGRYSAKVVRAGETWQFAHLELQADLMSHYPIGWQRKPASIADA